MGKLSNIREKLDRLESMKAENDERPSDALMSMVAVASANGAILQQTLREVMGAINKALEDNTIQSDELIGLQKSLHDAISQVSKRSDAVEKALSDAVGSIEKAVIAEIRAIKMPKAEQVDLSAIQQAIEKVEGDIKGLEFDVQMPETTKTQWTFDIVRDKRTGLIDKVIAK